MPSTASTLLTYAWNVLRTQGSSTSHPALQESTMLAVLNAANAEWQRTFYRGSGVAPKLLERETAFDLVADTALNGAITTASTSVIVDSGTNLSSSGAIVVWDDSIPDIIEYTSKSSNTLSGVTLIDFAHEDDDVVQKMYALPSNFSRLRAKEGWGDGVIVGGTPYYYTSGNPDSFRFTIYDNGTTKYLWLPRGVSGSAAVSYTKTSTTIDDTTDTVDVPTEYEWFLVHRLVEHGRRCRGDNADKVLEAKQQADMILNEAMRERNVGRIARTRPLSRFGLPKRDPLYEVYA